MLLLNIILVYSRLVFWSLKYHKRLMCYWSYLFAFFIHDTKITEHYLASVCGPFVDIYRGWSLEIAVMGHIVQHATSLSSYRFQMATVVEVSSRVFTPIVLKAGLVLMTSSLGTAANGTKDPRVADGHPAGSHDLPGDLMLHFKKSIA